MSESIRLSVEEIKEALGTDSAIYVGHITPAELLTGNGKARIDVAKRARIIIEKPFEEQSAVERTLTRLIGLVDSPEVGQELPDKQKDAIANQIGIVTGIYERSVAGQDHEVTIRSLFDAYFDTQGILAETDANHYLRVAGDDYAIEVGFDFDRAWELYEQSLEAAVRRY